MGRQKCYWFLMEFDVQSHSNKKVFKYRVNVHTWNVRKNGQILHPNYVIIFQHPKRNGHMILNEIYRYPY